MKIQCDVCAGDEATVYCSADEAAICAACDHRVHHVNILAGKHPRFSLLPPSPKDSPICDICQEKKAFLFCQQDRAILCKDCDVAIHKVNQHTQNHSRFLLTGVKLSPASELYSPTASNGIVPEQKPAAAAAAASVPVMSQTFSKTQKISTLTAPKSNGSRHGWATGSSISEYLIEMLPGWHVEDFLDSPATFSKMGDNDLAPFWDDSMNNSWSPETMGIWVPQAPPPAAPPPPPSGDTRVFQELQPGSNIEFAGQMMFDPNNNNMMTKSSRKWRSDEGNYFAVPQISHLSKRSRTLWQ